MELHKRYRPLEWDDVLGQETVAESVLAAIESGRTRSFLFTGPSGVGKTTIARLIAKEVDASGTKLLEVNAAKNTGVDNVRAIEDSLKFKPLGGGNRVLIVDEAHMLSRAAWNSLLKIIEEPPDGVYWCFCTTEPGKVPQTIQTRCLRYTLKPVPEEMIIELLNHIVEQEGYETPEEIVILCAERGDGSPRKAITSLEAVADCETVEDAAAILHEPLRDEDSATIRLCRALAGGAKFQNLIKIVSEIDQEKIQPESVRIIICAYFEKIILGAKSFKAAERAFAVMDAFADPYPQGARLAHILLSIGRLL